MKKILLGLLVISGLVTSCNKASNENSEEAQVTHRIVSLNGAITETIAALGNEGDIVGVDVTSTFPESVKTHAQDLGHVRGITLEPIIGLEPTLILASEKDLSPELQSKIKEAGIELKLINQEYSLQGSKKLVEDVAAAIGKKDVKSLTEKIDADAASLVTFEKAPKVLFIYARGAGTLQVAGDNTPFESIIKLAGGENAVKGFESFKPLTPEALVEGNPDVILLFDSGLESLGGVDGLLAVPGVSQTNAGKNKAVITLDGGLISNFGPRTGEAVAALNKALAEKNK